MTKNDYIVRALYLAVAVSIAVVVITLFTGCSSVRKLKKNIKQTEQVRTTEQTTKTKDSSSTTTISKIDSTGTTVTVVFDNDGKDTATNVEIITHPPHKEDYYQPSRTEVKTNRKPKSITVKQVAKNKQQQEVTAAVKTNETKAATTEKKTTTKTKESTKKKFVFHWWWLLIALAVLLIILFFKYNITPATALAWLRKQFTKTNNMKNLILLLLLSCTLFIGCVAPDKNNTTVKELQSLQRPGNPLDWEIVMKDTTGKYSVLQNGNYVEIDSTWKTQAKIPRSTFQLTMSSKQVKHFMHESNYFSTALLLGILVSIILITLAALFIKGDWMRFMGKGGAVGFLIVAAVGFNIRIYQKTPSELADNNKKLLSRTEYEAAFKEDSTFNKFWQQKWERNELVTLSNKNAVR